MSKSAWYDGREVVWKYTFRPIYKRFTVEYYAKQLDIKFCTNRLKVVRELRREEIFDKVYNDLLYILSKFSAR